MLKNKRILKALNNNLAVIKLIFSSAPLLGVGLLFDAFRAEFVNFFEHTYGVKFVLSSIEHEVDFKSVFVFICILLLIQMISALCSNIYSNFIETKYMPKVYMAAKQKLYNKIISIDLQYYDIPQYYDEQILALSEAEQIINRQCNLVKKIVSTLTIVICYGTFFIKTDTVSALFVLSAFLIQFVAHSIVSKVEVDVRVEQYKAEKKAKYINRMFYMRDYAKEFRIYKDTVERLIHKYKDALDDMYEAEKKVRIKRIILYFMIQAVGSKLAYNLAYMLYLVFKTVVLKSLSISSMVVLFNSTNSLRQGFVGLTEIIPSMLANSLYIDKVYNFLALKPCLETNGNLDVPKDRGVIEFQDVSFAYPNSDKNTISHLNLRFSLNDSVAIVGYNGAGKTTIIKLLLRFYDPTEGRILLNGINIKEYDIERYRAMFSAIFQDYNMYAISIYENIAMNFVQEEEKKHIDAILHKFGCDRLLTKKSASAENVFSKEFDEDGVDFSGGEIQKLILARGEYLSKRGIILDEPTSALDPVAEFELNRIISELIDNKMVLMISHRFSTIRNAKKIYVVENGRNVEEGTHDELISQNGHYSKLWNAQTELYQ